jgi:hypothetical protein
MMKSAPKVIIPVSVYLLFLVGCTSTYTLSLRDHKTHEPIANAPVTATSAPRFYSFLDIRHYLIGCGISEVVTGSTDDKGELSVRLPHDLPIERVASGDDWVAEWPFADSEWSPMLTQEKSESENGRDALDDQSRRPEVRVIQKR